MTKIVQEKQIIVYADADGTEPFSEWVDNLRDVIGRKRIFTRIDRLVHGNYGDCESVGEGVKELRMFFGSGYRVYFGEHGSKLVVLLSGGDKDTQPQDIKQAKLYWKEYLKHEKI